MDRSAFIQVAPQHYALAIAVFLKSRTEPATRDMVLSHYSDQEDYEETQYLGHGALVDAAMLWLEKIGIISIDRDPFAPDIYEYIDQSEFNWFILINDKELPFKRYFTTGENRSYIVSTLVKVNQQWEQLGITPKDFVKIDAEWEPIPLDRTDPDLVSVIDRLDSAIELVRSDNGYSANVPEEQAFVLDNLMSLSRRLTTAASISMPYLRSGLEGMTKLTRRFGDASLGIAAALAKEAIKDWVRKRGVTLLDWLWA